LAHGETDLRAGAGGRDLRHRGCDGAFFTATDHRKGPRAFFRDHDPEDALRHALRGDDLQSAPTDRACGAHRAARIRLQQKRQVDRAPELDVAEIEQRKRRARQRDPFDRIRPATDAQLPSSSGRKRHRESSVRAGTRVATLHVQRIVGGLKRRRIGQADDVNARDRLAAGQDPSAGRAWRLQPNRNRRRGWRQGDGRASELRMPRHDLVLCFSDALKLERAVRRRQGLSRKHAFSVRLRHRSRLRRFDQPKHGQ